MSDNFIIRQINAVIDFFYPPFSSIMPIQTFRYAATGGANTAFDIVLYFVFYNFVLQKELVDLGFIAISPHIAAFFMSFAITFPTGFLLAKFITFTESELRGRVQLFRYGLTVLMSIFLNYIFLKLFVEYIGIYPTVSKIITTGIVIVFSFLSQKYFTFKVKKSSAETCCDVN